MYSHIFQETSYPHRYGFPQASGKNTQTAGYHCKLSQEQEPFEDIKHFSCYDIEVDISKNFKSLFIVCHSVNDKWRFRKNIGRLLEIEREVDLQSDHEPSFREWGNLQKYYSTDSRRESLWKLYCKRGITFPYKKIQPLLPAKEDICQLGSKENGIDEDDAQVIFASALDQIRNLNKEIVALSERVNNSLDRMDQMEHKSGSL